MNEVKITIEGKLMTGKTTIASTIVEALEKLGYNVSFNLKDIRNDWSAFDHAKAKQTHIHIEEHQLPRVP